ncbi:MAG: NAD+ synthase [Syntrophobacterales bacterium]|nr:NAD+ synthase [Syntrophobacterales bacterium]
MKIGLAQINPLIGDFYGNVELTARMAEEAKQRGCSLVIFPELSLIGYPPRDLLDKPSFVDSSMKVLPYLERISEKIGIVFGLITRNELPSGKPYRNTAIFMNKGKIILKAHKRLLPFYDVFDEERYFEPGIETATFSFEGFHFGLTICEDIWNREGILPRRFYPVDPVEDLKKHRISAAINIAASPYFVGKMEQVMVPLLSRVANEIEAPVIYVNQVGGNDELIFQGHSMVVTPKGEIVCRGASFEEDLIVFDLKEIKGDLRIDYSLRIDQLIDALVLGIRDYVRKCGFPGVVIGLSGGIDSAVTASLAVIALGAERVWGIAMPGPYSSPESLEDAEQLSMRLGIRFSVVPIVEMYKATCDGLSEIFKGMAPDVTEENIQARLRGLVLMAISNKFGLLLLSTGNKSELAVGYCTLYGDMNGGLAVIGDVPKSLVYQIAQRINSHHDWIPKRIIEKPPSAELRPNQKDQDTLPPYDILDSILELYVGENLSFEDIVGRGFDKATTEQVIRMVVKNEYKRRQAPPVLKVTSKAFGLGRRMPIAHGYKEV